jgi:biotin synthase
LTFAISPLILIRISAYRSGIRQTTTRESTFIMSETAIDELLEKWDEEHVLTKEEALEVLNLPDDKLDKLIETAYALRLKYKGKKVSIQLLTNVRSGNCSQNCAYCAQSCESHAAIEKYKRVSDEKLYGDNDLVDEKHLARHCIGLSGISFTDAEIEDLADRIRKMKKNDTQICCSIGFLTEKQARMLKDAGLNRINHNLNSSRSYYPNICTTHTYDQRINNIRMLKSIGFEMCCGGIIGMGESKSDVVDMLMDIREINPESVPINFLLPIKGTRLADRDISGLTQQYCLKVLCLARLMVPKSDIRCAAGREVYFKGIEPTLFKVVDSIFASGYLTAGGQGIDDTLNMIKEAGFTGEIESTDR